ncbi:hypothetical protein FBU59_003018 [Linderina macrospora]|uniref:Uncharacterized protein n=1 Tax=Linderina macrospora TaxID=4868 RepID=A0ACC1J9J5_9FUNG|nr:hypothetical protein FBU59_003018 [Linderina macrospora]
MSSPQNTHHPRRKFKITRLHLVQASVILIVVMMAWGKRMGSSLLSPLKSTLKKELHINNTQWSSVISMVWVVSSITPFLAGLVVDSLGAPLAAALSVFLILAGNGVCAIAVATHRLNIFLLGRAIYSVGGGAVLLVGEVIMLKWFKGRSLPIAYGVSSTISSIMSFSGPATVTAVLSSHAKTAIPFWIATGLSAFGLICVGVYALIHYSHFAKEVSARGSSEGTPQIIRSPALRGNETVQEEDEFSPKQHPTVAVLHPVRAEQLLPFDDSESDIPSPSTSPSQKHGLLGRWWNRSINLFLGLSALPESYWHMLLCVSIQGTLFIPLHEIVPEMMETEWGYTKAKASRLFVYLHFVPIVLHVVTGIVINRYGHRINIFCLGSVLVFMAAIFIRFARKVPVILSLVLMNVSGSLVPASIFSLMNIVIDNGEIAGAALGLIRSAEFASVTLMEMLDGLLQDADHNRYDTVLIGLVVFAAFLLIVAVASVYHDYMRNRGLLNSANPYDKSGRRKSAQAHASGQSSSSEFEEKPEVSEMDSQTQASSVTADVPTPIPKRRFLYMGTIIVLLLVAWILFIYSLARI